MSKFINATINALENTGAILYPTDTVWGLGCDATNEIAVQKIYEVKKRDESKSLVILVDSMEMLKEYVANVPRKAMEILEKSKKPTTIIYNNPNGLASNVIAKDNTVAIRIVQNEFCHQLIEKFGKPIVSTSANISGEPTPKSFKEIETSVLEAVDYVVNLHQDIVADTPSRIIKINKEGNLEVIRD